MGQQVQCRQMMSWQSSPALATNTNPFSVLTAAMLNAPCKSVLLLCHYCHTLDLNLNFEAMLALAPSATVLGFSHSPDIEEERLSSWQSTSRRFGLIAVSYHNTPSFGLPGQHCSEKTELGLHANLKPCRIETGHLAYPKPVRLQVKPASQAQNHCCCHTGQSWSRHARLQKYSMCLFYNVCVRHDKAKDQPGR